MDDFFILDVQEAVKLGQCQRLAMYIKGHACTIQEVDATLKKELYNMTDKAKCDVQAMLNSFKKSKALIALKSI